MTTNVIDFNLPALALLIMLMFASIFRKMTRSISGQIFYTLIFVSFISTFFAACTIRMEHIFLANPERSTDFFLALRYLLHYLYLLTHILSTPIYIMYIISLTDTWHLLRNNKSMKLFITVPFLIVAVMMIINIPTHSVFYIDSNLIYRRGVLFPLLYVLAFTYLVYGFIYLFKHKHLFSLEVLISLYSIFPLMVLSILFQWLNKGCQVEMFATAISILLITITIERPEHQIDSFTELKKHSAYAADMKRSFLTKKPVTIIAVNIANFNAIISIAGFDSVSALLVQISRRLEEIDKSFNTKASIYYLDRGRFRFVLNDLYRNIVPEISEKINDLFLEKWTINGMEFNLRPHTCILRCPEDISEYKHLMAFGEDFHIKQPYTGTVMDVSALTGAERVNITSQIDNIIEKALAKNSFKVYYQPIYSVKEKRFVSAEALLRLIDDEYGFISPAIFIPAAEKSGAILRIGEFVLDDVCRFISEGSCDKLGLDYIEINLSVAQCMQADLADKVLEILNKHKVSPERINLEITETAASYAQDIMTENLKILTDNNVSFSLDDYGTGYSNIKSVASLPLKIVKLDKTFVDEVENPRMLIVLRNTIKMLKDMNIEIVVEGVETKAITDKITELRCEYIQGYYFSRPLPENDFINFMENAANA